MVGVASLQVLYDRNCAMIALFEGYEPGAAVNRYLGCGSSLFKQDRFEIDLVDAVGRFRCRLSSVGALSYRVAITPARYWDAREFDTGKCCTKCHVVRIVGWQSRATDALGNS